MAQLPPDSPAAGAECFADTPEQQQMRRSIREFAAREIAPHAARWDEQSEFPTDAVRQLGRMGLLGGRQILSSGVRALAAAVVAFLPAAWLAGPLAARLGPEHWLSWVVTLGVVGVLGVAIYAGACWLFRVPELQGIVDLVLARLRRRAGAEPA